MAYSKIIYFDVNQVPILLIFPNYLKPFNQSLLYNIAFQFRYIAIEPNVNSLFIL